MFKMKEVNMIYARAVDGARNRTCIRRVVKFYSKQQDNHTFTAFIMGLAVFF